MAETRLDRGGRVRMTAVRWYGPLDLSGSGTGLTDSGGNLSHSNDVVFQFDSTSHFQRRCILCYESCLCSGNCQKKITPQVFANVCQYTVTGRDRKFDLQLLSQCGSMHNCLNRSVSEIHQRVAGTLSSQQTTKYKSTCVRVCVCE